MMAPKFVGRVLAIKLSAMVLALSLLATVLVTAAQLHQTYVEQIDVMHDRMTEVDQSVAPALAESLWLVDPAGVDARLAEVMAVRGVVYLRLDSEGRTMVMGKAARKPLAARTFPLRYRDGNRSVALGTLQVQFGRGWLMKRLRTEAAHQGFSTLAAMLTSAIALLWLFHGWVTRPLEAMARHVGAMRVDNLHQPLVLPERLIRRTPDEIDQVAIAINRMREYLADHVAVRARNEQELTMHRQRLELLVQQRTAELEVKTRALEEQSQLLEQQANTDALTGVCSRRHFLALAEREMARCRRTGSALTVMMLDIDHFKRINDTWGHATGDRALVATADCCRRQLREVDVIGRLGGEEFGILLPAADPGFATAAADRLLEAVRSLRVTPDDGGAPFGLTVSIGASSGRDPRSFDAMLASADRALYRAKHEGRNRAMFEGLPLDDAGSVAGSAGPRDLDRVT